jgi:hypothetical protein
MRRRDFLKVIGGAGIEALQDEHCTAIAATRS